MELLSLKCPSCDAELKLAEGEKLTFCSYCGCQIAADDGTRKIVYEDVAQSKQVALDEKIYFHREKRQAEEQERIRQEQLSRKQELDSRKKRHRIWLLCVVMCFAVYTALIFCSIAYLEFNVIIIAIVFGLISPILMAGLRPIEGKKVRLCLLYYTLYLVIFGLAGSLSAEIVKLIPRGG